MKVPTTAPIEVAPIWKRVLAVILDLVTTFAGFGMAIAWATGSTTTGGFSLDGWPALLLFALMIAYFIIGRRYLGGTLWDRILGIGRPQPT
ncbi:MAG: hypothetical protein IT536_11345 [Hyphomicrobiales bacterium]|nr:hypothetical protein [Hyphomicrobiales bacterium]